MAFTFDNFRNLFGGHKSEQVQPSFSPVSGRDLEQVHDRLGNVRARQETTVPEAPISSQGQEKHTEERRQEFGTIYQTNVMLPDGSLGHSERRSRFEISEREDNQFDLTLIRRNYLYSGNQLVSERDLTQGMYGPDTYGPFPDRATAESFRNSFIGDYNQTASEEHAAAVEWQKKQDHEAYYGKAEDPPEPASNSTSVSSLANSLDLLAESLAEQENKIRQEWQHDLASGKQNQHDLETYFAGKVDQHNTMIELAVEANPKLQETLPPQINYEQLRSTVQEQFQQRQKTPAQAMEMTI
jgi:hypothetical protein